VERLERVLGTGAKALAPSERLNYGRSNRSIHARRAVKKGELLTMENVAVLRTEKNLKPGLEPVHLDTVLRKRTIRPIPDGAGITWEDLLAP